MKLHCRLRSRLLDYIQLLSNPDSFTNEVVMHSTLEFKLTVSEDGEKIYSRALSFEEVSSLVSSARDSKENEPFFAVAARHPASAVRECAASRDNLPDETVKLLMSDKSINVLRSLTRSRKFIQLASTEDLQRLSSIDTELAQNIACNVESFVEADTMKLAEFYAAHSDPGVVSYLAGNYATPKRVLRGLLKHSDPHVANEAKEQLG